MNKPGFLSLKDFHYDLPEERIARYPLPERDSSRLLVFKENQISTDIFANLASHIPSGSHLVFNETKVIHARIKFKKQTGAAIEIFCLEPFVPFDYQQNFASRQTVTWKCLVGNSKKWKEEVLEKKADNGLTLYAIKKGRMEGAFRIEFSWTQPELSFSEVIEAFGSTPIPPYLNREAEYSDSENYQTVYSKNEGSVAAPTAGLHFTENLLADISAGGIEKSFLNLHVGAGTFVPVKSENAVEHEMHIERIVVSKNCIEKLLDKHTTIIPVGTTSCRSLESLYWIGQQMINGTFEPASPLLKQWDAYSIPASEDRGKVLETLLDYLDRSGEEELTVSTGIMITPGYEFKMTDALITNFHQPSSTLLMLIAALTGESWRSIYAYALSHDFRFLSYGDSNLLFPASCD